MFSGSLTSRQVSELLSISVAYVYLLSRSFHLLYKATYFESFQIVILLCEQNLRE